MIIWFMYGENKGKAQNDDTNENEWSFWSFL